MNSADGQGLCRLSDLRDYLQTKNEVWLLKCVRENDGKYELVEEEYARMHLPSIRYQIACIFMLLG
ncbi:MAG: hypothetical protein QOH21_74, partial [Acidobacteriota bacterium]|nr:hypothetical protein [Acidobacteriota bacterium]